MITRVFWTVVALDAIAAVVLWKLFERGTHGLLAAVFLVVVAAIVLTTCTFLLLRSDGLRIAAFIVPVTGRTLLACGITSRSAGKRTIRMLRNSRT
jgi:hypothetical protein